MSSLRSVPGGLIAVAATIQMAGKMVGMINEETRRRDREKTTKALEWEMDKAHQELKNKMKAVHKDFEKLRKSFEVQLLRADPEQEQGKKEEEIARALEIRLKKNLRELSQRIQTLEEHVQEWRETIMNELHLLRAELERIQGKKEEEIARALEIRLKKKFRQLSQRIQTLGEDLKEWPETTNSELHLLRAELENKLGTSAQKIQIIFMTQSPELAKGKWINIRTDSKYADEVVHDHGDVWKERGLLAAEDFSRSASGREVEWTIPGAPDDPRGHQDQRRTCQDS